MNLGLPDELKTSFPDIMPVNRPIIMSIINYDPYWLAGFTSADWCPVAPCCICVMNCCPLCICVMNCCPFCNCVMGIQG